jgi:hypothetical protein
MQITCAIYVSFIDNGVQEYYYAAIQTMMASLLKHLTDRARLLLYGMTLAAILMPAGTSLAASFNQLSGKQSSEKQPSQTEESSVAVTGYFNARYTFRTAETTSGDVARQQIAYGELRIDATTPKTGRYEFHFMGNVRNNFDGNRDIHTYYPLEDIGHTGPDHTVGYLYEAHLDINEPFSRVTQIRMGRQASTRGEPVYFDGIAMDVRPAQKVNLTLYGGAGVNFYEINRSEGDDTVAGAGIDLYPTNSTGIGLDYLYIKDRRDYLQLTDVQDDLLSLRIWQRITPSIKATANFRYQNGEARDLNLRILGSFPASGTEFGAGYLRQFNIQSVQSNPLSPFVDVMGPTTPFQLIEVKVRQFFGTRYAVDLAYSRRDLIGSDPPGEFNHEFSRATAGFEISDLLTRNLSLTLTGDAWRSDGRDYTSGGADIGYSFGKKGKLAKINAGTYYSLYKYDYYQQLGEQDRVRTYYVTVKAPLARQLSLNVNYEYEQTIENFQTLRTAIRYDF